MGSLILQSRCLHFYFWLPFFKYGFEHLSSYQLQGRLSSCSQLETSVHFEFQMIRDRFHYIAVSGLMRGLDGRCRPSVP